MTDTPRTRRIGWKFAKPGDHVTLCRKVMGRKKDEPLERIADVELVSVTDTILDTITADEVSREGFPGWTPYEFVDFFCRHMKVESWVTVTRIEWRYLDEVGER